MRTYAPDYYGEFRCIADKCQHTCCVGWEIDIDDESLARYRQMKGPFAQRLSAAIEGGDPAHFRLDGRERCPMLNENGLCDLITECGEGALCQICADHPRYRSFFTGRTEIGLGLCCEAAARLVLGREEPARWVLLADDGENDDLPEDEEDLLAFRAECVAVMQDREMPIDMRLEVLLTQVDAAAFLAPGDWAEVYRGLERLDPAWDAALDLLGGEWHVLPGLETAFEQWAVYLLGRHLPGGLEDDDWEGRVKFCVLSTRVLMAACWGWAQVHGECGLDACAELARMYSAEIEYDEGNIEALLDKLAE